MMDSTEILHAIQTHCPSLVEKLGGRLDLTDDCTFELLKFVEMVEDECECE